MALFCNHISHWLGTRLESALPYVKTYVITGVTVQSKYLQHAIYASWVDSLLASRTIHTVLGSHGLFHILLAHPWEQSYLPARNLSMAFLSGISGRLLNPQCTAAHPETSALIDIPIYIQISQTQKLHYPLIWGHTDNSRGTAYGLGNSLDYHLHPDSKVHGANMGPTRDRQGPGWPRVGPTNLDIWAGYEIKNTVSIEMQQFWQIWIKNFIITMRWQNFTTLWCWFRYIRLKRDRQYLYLRVVMW